MSILIPALAKAKKQANLVICRSNLHQWGVIFLAYTDDNGGYFQGGWGGSQANSRWWMDATRRYYGNQPKIRCCPTAANPNRTIYNGYFNSGVWDMSVSFPGTIPGTNQPRPVPDYGSYGINGWVENASTTVTDGSTNPAWNWKTPNVKGAAKVPLLMDAPWIDCWPKENDNPPELDNLNWRDSTPSIGMGRFCKNRHEGYINCLFLDFSVSKIGLKQMWTLKWHRTFNTCGRWTICGGANAATWDAAAPWMRNFPEY